MGFLAVVAVLLLVSAFPITGNYKVDSNPYGANAPDILGESIKEKIGEHIRSQR